MKNSYAAMILVAVFGVQGVVVSTNRPTDKLNKSYGSLVQPPKAPRLRPMQHQMDDVPPFMLGDIPVADNLKSLLLHYGVDADAVSGFGDYIIKLTARCYLLEMCNDTDLQVYAQKLFNSLDYPQVAYALVKRMSGLQHQQLLFRVLAAKIKKAPGIWSRWWPKEEKALQDIAQYCDIVVRNLSDRALIQ